MSTGENVHFGEAISDGEVMYEGNYEEGSYYGDGETSVSSDEDDDDETMEKVDDTKSSSMELTCQERLRALAIKEAVEASPELENLQDVDYARYALVVGEDIPNALARIEAMQDFRKEYKISNSVDQGVYFVDLFMKHQPGVLLNIDVCPVTEEGVLVWDNGALNAQKIMKCTSSDTVTEEKWKSCVISWYYIMCALQPTLASTREGAFVMAEGGTIDWGCFSLAYETRLHDELWAHYPQSLKKLMVYNINTVCSVILGLLKKLFPPKWRAVIEVGCQVEYVKELSPPKVLLSDLYLQPNVETANFYNLQKVRELLTQRLQNESSFRL